MALSKKDITLKVVLQHCVALQGYFDYERLTPVDGVIIRDMLETMERDLREVLEE